MARPALAQVLPQTLENEAARQQREIERQTAPQRQRGPGVAAPTPGPRLEFPAGGDRTAEADRVRRLQVSQLRRTRRIRARYLGRKVDLAAIGKLVLEVNDLYAAKGQITASAVLPPQKLDGGVLTVKLVEGRFGKVGISGAVQTCTWFVRSQVPSRRARSSMRRHSTARSRSKAILCRSMPT